MDKLNPQYHLDTFVVCSENQAAHEAAIQVSDFPGKTYNPLVIYGRAGTGKSHLLHGIASRMPIKFPAFNICFATTESFIRNFVNARRFNKITEFRERLSKIDALLLDSVQFFANKKMTQEEMVRLSNALIKRNKQIVVTTDHPPSEIEGVGALLIAILSEGHIVRTGISAEAKMQILMKIADAEKIELPDAVKEFIVDNVGDDIVILIGFTMRLSSYIKSTGDKITLNVVSKIMFGSIKA